MTAEANFVLPLLREGVDPAFELGALRTEGPVAKLELPEGINVGAWLITRYEDAKAVLGDRERFSNDFTKLTEAGDLTDLINQDPGGLGLLDPPDHTRLRKIVTPEFTMRRPVECRPAGVVRAADRADHHRAPRCIGESRPRCRPGRALRRTDSRTRHLRAARGAVRGPR